MQSPQQSPDLVKVVFGLTTSCITSFIPLAYQLVGRRAGAVKQLNLCNLTKEPTQATVQDTGPGLPHIQL